MKQEGSIVILILLAILILAAVGGIFYLGRASSQKNLPVTSETTHVANPTILPIASSSSLDGMTNLKTYTNTKYNLSIQYPSEWREEQGNGKHGDADALVRLRSDNNPFGGPYLGISVFDNPNKLIAQEYAEKLISKNSNIYILNEQAAYLQKYDAIMIDGLPGAGKSGPSAVINDKKGHIILLYTTGLDQKVIDSIISTFKFTN